MPKCEVDSALQEQVHRFMSENGLTISGAAVKLGVGRTTFWRFCDSGRARSDTRALYREALDKRNNKTGTNVSDLPDLPVGQARVPLQGRPADSELRLIRRACESVLALLDVYEAQSLGKEIERTSAQQLKRKGKGRGYVRD